VTPDATPAGPAPPAEPVSDGADDLHERIHVEPVAATPEALDDALDALAALLLDSQATRRDQGALPTPIATPIRPDARRREARSVAPPAGGEAA
jgi:hypothetical protein